MELVEFIKTYWGVILLGCNFIQGVAWILCKILRKRHYIGNGEFCDDPNCKYRKEYESYEPD